MKYRTALIFLFFLSCGDTQKVIKIKGSDTEVNLAVMLVEHFQQTDKDYTVSVSGGGSGLGIASLLNGQADIANSSRPLTQEEKHLFEEKHMALRTVTFAEDATAFIVHRDFPADSLNVDILSKLMSGEYHSWKRVTGKDVPVTIYGRQSNSGTHSFVKNKLHIEFSRDAKEMNGNAQILESVKQDVSGIGYVGAGYIAADSASKAGRSIKVLKIAAEGSPAISPLDRAAILHHQYFFQRPLFQFVRQPSWEKVQPFLRFETSKAGKALIEKEGYYIIE